MRRIILYIYLLVPCLFLKAQVDQVLVPDKEEVMANYAELQEPIILLLTGNRRFEGTLSQVEEGRIVLRVIQAGGEILLGFTEKEIVEIRFPGEEILADTKGLVAEEAWAEALPSMEALLLQRQAFFHLLEDRDKNLFVHLPKMALYNNEPARAIAYADFLENHLKGKSEQKKLENSLLVAYYIMALNRQTTERADAWIQSRPRYHSSALGYFVRSALYFQEEDYENAFWLSLEPIVFSGQTPVDYLAHCYAIAIASAHLTGKGDYSQKLQEEMFRRGLDWQYLNAFQEVKGKLDNLLIYQREQAEAIPLFEALAPKENLLMDLDRSVGDGSFIDPSSILSH